LWVFIFILSRVVSWQTGLTCQAEWCGTFLGKFSQLAAVRLQSPGPVPAVGETGACVWLMNPEKEI
jgi:hypothetical protein